MSHTSRLVAAEIQNANQLLNGVIEAVITTTPDDSMPGFGLQVRRGKQLFNVWVCFCEFRFSSSPTSTPSGKLISFTYIYIIFLLSLIRNSK